MLTKLLGSLDDEALASIAVAGIRVLAQGTSAPTTSAAATYTVTDDNTRRVMAITLGATSAAAGDIRFAINTTAVSTNCPLIPQRYAVFYLTKGETISFYNTSADTVTVYLVEIM